MQKGSRVKRWFSHVPLSFIRVEAPFKKEAPTFRDALPQRMMGREEKAFEASMMEAGSAHTRLWGVVPKQGLLQRSPDQRNMSGAGISLHLQHIVLIS